MTRNEAGGTLEELRDDRGYAEMDCDEYHSCMGIRRQVSVF